MTFFARRGWRRSVGRIRGPVPATIVMVTADVVRAGLVAVMAIPGQPIVSLVVLLVVVQLLAAPSMAARNAILPVDSDRRSLRHWHHDHPHQLPARPYRRSRDRRRRGRRPGHQPSSADRRRDIRRLVRGRVLWCPPAPARPGRCGRARKSTWWPTVRAGFGSSGRTEAGGR